MYSMIATFSRPVTVLVGLGFPRRLLSASEALSFLEANPAGDEAFEAAVSVCRDALEGLTTPQHAQDIVSAYAQRRGVYVDEIEALAA